MPLILLLPLRCKRTEFLRCFIMLVGGRKGWRGGGSVKATWPSGVGKCWFIFNLMFGISQFALHLKWSWLLIKMIFSHLQLAVCLRFDNIYNLKLELKNCVRNQYLTRWDNCLIDIVCITVPGNGIGNKISQTYLSAIDI